MTEQNFQNHSRLHPFYHYILMPVSLGGIVYSGIQLVKSLSGDFQLPLLVFIAFLLLFGTIGLLRIYSLKVQDRVIRSEENFRHYLLTGKQLDRQLRSGQVVALRFASDAEFVALAARAISENLSPKAIKKSITQWRPDYRRV